MNLKKAGLHLFWYVEDLIFLPIDVGLAIFAWRVHRLFKRDGVKL